MIDIERANHLLARTTPTPSGCMEYTGCVQGNGYARATVARKTDYAHRHIYRLLKGDIPDGMDVCHVCDNRKCINPSHLFIGTRTDNMRDAKNKGRLSVGEAHAERIKHRKTKLSEAKVRVIRAVAGNVASTQELADMFGVDYSLIRLVVNRKIWRHI